LIEINSKKLSAEDEDTVLMAMCSYQIQWMNDRNNNWDKNKKIKKLKKNIDKIINLIIEDYPKND
jgi:hypothetical protein